MPILYYILSLCWELGFILAAGLWLPGRVSQDFWFGLLLFSFVSYLLIAIWRRSLPFVWLRGLGLLEKLFRDINLKGQKAVALSAGLILTGLAGAAVLLRYYNYLSVSFLAALPFGLAYSSILYFFNRRALQDAG